LAQSGTGASLTASNGGIVYSDASAMAILAGTATAGRMLQSGSNAAPSWSTATYPATISNTLIPFATSANVIGTSTNLAFVGDTFTTLDVQCRDLNSSGGAAIGNEATDTLAFAANAVTWTNNPTHSGNHIFSGNVSVNGNTTIGNAAGDALTIAPDAVTWTNNPTHSGNHTFSQTITASGLAAVALQLENATSTTRANAFCAGSKFTLSSSGGLTNADGFRAHTATLSSTGEITNHTGFRAQDMGHATLVTNARGFLAQEQTGSVTLSLGFESQVSSGTGKWGFYASGTADNAFTGNVRIGSTTAPTVALDLTGAAKISSTLGVTGVATFADTTATPAGGSTAARILFGTTAGFGVYYGSGAPTVSAAQGSLYLRSDGSSSSTRAYINSNGSTTWQPITTAA
jgi:hypothetical protein